MAIIGMAIFVYPKEITKAQLLEKIHEKLNSNTDSPTWEMRNLQIVHTAESEQWDQGAYLIIEETRDPYLRFLLKHNDGASPKKGTYGVYNGRFVQFLLNHFTKYIDQYLVNDLR